MATPENAVRVRMQRKADHIRLAASRYAPVDHFAEVHLVHQAVPELSVADLDLSTEVAGLAWPVPVYINAMTGGSPLVAAINEALATLAARHRLPMAVGSQQAALDAPSLSDTYRVVRRANPRGVIMANVGAGCSLQQAERAVRMLDADYLQVHLNAAQELIMPEGERNFRGWLARIGALVRWSPVPVIVKEVGFGITREAALLLYDVGVRCIDVGGRGGTNFAAIEAARGGRRLDPGLQEWGHPTPCCLAEVLELDLPGLHVLAAGGIRFGSQAAKALAMGARAVGLAGGLLRRLTGGDGTEVSEEGMAAAGQWLLDFLQDLRTAVLLTGAHNLTELRRAPVVVTGATAEWCMRRGVDLTRFSRPQREAGR